MGSDVIPRTENNRMRPLETKVVNVNDRRALTKSHYGDDAWDHESTVNVNDRRAFLSRCKDPRSFPHELYADKKPAKAILANKIKSISSGEIHAGEFVLQNTRYIVINNRVYKDRRSTSRLDMLSPSTDVGSTTALAGLIFMCNDRMRRSFLKYRVLGVPLAKKPILDRVNASTKLFLFEFEARALWGIYEATSEASLDIEKDAYRGSETSFPAQVKVRVYKQCRPLPEELFQRAIEDNYFTPTKFNFELTFEQVSNLTKLYNMRDVEKYGRAISAAETSIPCETVGRDLLSEGQDGIFYQSDGVRVNDLAALDALKNMSYSERRQTTYRLDKLSQTREGLVRGNDNTEMNICMGGKHLGNAEYDALKHFSLYHKGNPFSKTHKDHPISKKQELENMTVSDPNGGHASRSSLHADANTTLLDLRTTTLCRYAHEKEDILSEDDLRHQLSQSKLPLLADDPTYESDTQGMSARFRSPFVNLSDAVLDSKTSYEPSLNEEYYLSKLKTKQVNDSILLRKLPLRSPIEHVRGEASVYQRLGKGPSLGDDALWDLQSESKIFSPSTTVRNPPQTFSTHPAQIAPAMSQLPSWQMRDILQGTGNGYTTQCLTRSPTNQRTLTMPGKVWMESHDHHVDGFVRRAKVCSRIPDDEAWRGKLCHEIFSSRSKISQDGALAQVENTQCFATCRTARSNTSESDDPECFGSTPCAAVHSFVPQFQKVEDDEAWLKSARREVANSFTSRNWDGADDILEDDEQDLSSMQVENHVSTSLPQLSTKQPRFTVTANVLAGEDDMKSRRSVWSRLSTSKKISKSRKVAEEVILPDEDLGELQLSSRSVPWKRRTASTLTCSTPPTNCEVGEELSIEEECLSFGRNEVNIDFKRRKGTLNRIVSLDITNEQMGTMERKSTRDYCDKQRERRRIKRPL